MLSPSITRAFSVLACSAVVAACEQNADHSTASAEPIRAAPLHWTLGAPVSAVGEDEQLPGHALRDVIRAIRRPGGRLVVAHGSNEELLLFDPAGRLIRQFGGAGRGQGELRGLQDVWQLPDGTLAAWDAGNARISYWSADGEFIRDQRFDLATQPVVHGPLADGSFLIAHVSHPPIRWEVGTVVHDSVTLALLRPDLTQGREFGRFYSRITHIVLSADGLGPMATSVPFDPMGRFAVGPNVFYHSNGLDWEVLRYSVETGSVDTLRTTHAHRARTRAMYDAWLDARLSAVARNERPQLRTFLTTNMPPPRDVLPTFTALVVDDLGHLWAGHAVAHTDTAAVWSIFSPAGEWLGDLSLPSGLTVSHVSERHLTGILRDDDGVESVAVFPLNRGR
jgi:hypothetical protein